MTQENVASATSNAGTMTARMRAASPMGALKVLRIGVVLDRKVIEERIVRQRVSVTVGPSEKSMFVIAAQGVPPSFKLFELVGNDYYLNFLDIFSGSISRRPGVVEELSALRGQAKRVPLGNGHMYQVPLTDEARGKIVIGDRMLLFQFVAPPLVQPKPDLPVTIKTGLGSDIDWTTTIIAAFSFLLHFGAVGSIYSDWLDPPVDDQLDVQQLLESVKSLPPPPPVETPKETTEAPTTTAAAATEAPKTSTGGGAKGAGGGGKITDARATAISNELNQLQVQMLGALSSTGSATNSVLSDSNAALGLLDNAAASGAGVGMGGIPGLNFGTTGGGALKPGSSGDKSLSALATDTAAAAPTTAGSAQKVKGPTGSAQVGGPNVTGGSVANASAIVGAMAAGFRACYNRGLSEDPTMKGSVRITAKIGPNGEVVSATPSGSGLSPSVIACVVRRVQSATFSPPEGGGATIVIPVTFVSQ